MNRESQVRSVAVLLFLLTVAAVVFAGFNFRMRSEFLVPDDGDLVDGTWRPSYADRVDRTDPEPKVASSRATNCFQSTARKSRTCRAWSGRCTAPGYGRRLLIRCIRQSVPLDSSVILVPADRSLNNWLRLIALIYLGIGVYVLLRRWTAPGSTHFYIFCLVSFIVYSFKYTGKLNDFDWIDLLGQHRRGGAAAGAVPALCSDIPGEAAVRAQAWLGCCRWFTFQERCCWRCHMLRHALAASQRAVALEPRPAGNVLRRRFLSGCSSCSVVQLPARQHDDPAPAIEVGDARHDSGHHSLTRLFYVFLT